MAVVGGNGMGQPEGGTRVEPLMFQRIQQQDCRSYVMAIRLIRLQAIAAEMAAAELALESWAGLAEIVQANQGDNPALRAWQRDWTRHDGQQHRCHCSDIEKMGQQGVPELFRA